jgi:hypothetical protein
VDITDGVYHKGVELINGLSEERRVEKDRRLGICKGCSLYNNGYCDSKRYEEVDGYKVYGCGCNLELKSLSSRSRCPLGKW